MRILSPASNIPLIQLFLLSAMISTWGAFSTPNSSGNHNNLLSEAIEEERTEHSSITCMSFHKAVTSFKKK